jgi:hypothetical protein
VTGRTRRATSCLLAVAAAVAAHLGGGATAALADGPPVVTNVLPGTVVLTGKPLHVTLIGTNLSQAISVSLAPAVPGLSFASANDQTLLVTLPAAIAAGGYSVMVTTTGGTSDPGAAPQFTVATPLSTANAAPPPPPRYSFAPTPTLAPAAGTGVTQGAGTGAGHGAGSPRPAAAAPRSAGAPASPVLLLPLGAVLGALTFMLWGRPGRLAAAARRGLGAQLVARPAQALRVGRICLHCGRLHLVLRTRRDLWRAGQFCSATCFVAAQDEDSAARAAETAAEARMRHLFRERETDRVHEEPPDAGRNASRGVDSTAVTAAALVAAD